MKCYNCGAEMEAGDIFCGSCGAHAAAEIQTGISGTARVDQKRSPVELFHRAAASASGITRALTPGRIAAIAAALLVLITSLAVVFHKTDEEKIENCLNQMAESYNEGDFEGMIACFEPKAQKMINGMFDIGGSLLGSAFPLFGGIDLEDIWSMGGIRLGSSEMTTLYLSIDHVSFNEEKDGAAVDITVYEGDKNSGSGEIQMVKQSGKWYVAMDGGLF